MSNFTTELIKNLSNNVSVKEIFRAELEKAFNQLLETELACFLGYEKCTVVDCKSGIAVGSSRNATITKCNITSTAYGIRGNGEETDSALTVTDCNIKAHIPVVIRKVSKGYSLTVNGTNTMTQTNTEGLWCVVASNEYGDVDKAGLTAVSAAVSVTVNDTALNVSGVFVKE